MARPLSLKNKYFVVIGLALFLACWRRLYFDAWLPWDGDTLRLVYPSWLIGKELLKDGASLLWDPYRNMGQPYLASPPNQALYPLQWLNPFLDFLRYKQLFVAAHSFLLAFYGWKLARLLKADGIAAFFLAIGLSLNGSVLCKATLHADFAALAWAPAAVYYLMQRKPFQLAFCLALQWLAGLPPFFLLTGFLLVGVVLSESTAKEGFFCLLKGYALGLSLCAVQWIPFLEMLRLSFRGAFVSSATALEYSLHPLELLRGLLCPALLEPRLPLVSDSDLAVTGFFLGPPVTLLFLAALVRGKPRERRLAAAAGLCFILALGKYIGFYPWLGFTRLFRFPALWLFPAVILSLIAGTAFLKNRRPRTRLFLVAWSCLEFLINAQTARLPWGDLDFLNSPIPRIAGVETIPDGTRLFHTSQITQTVHRWKFTTNEDWLKLKYFLVPSIGIAHGIRDVESRSQLTSRRHVAFLQRLNASPPDSPLFDMARVDNIIALTGGADSKPIPGWEDGKVLTNPNPKPRAFLIDGRAARILWDKPGKVRCEVEGPGRVVLSESYYPGWRATVDGRSSCLVAEEEAFLATEIGPGRHDILFFYRPFSFLVGLAVSLLAFVSFSTWLWTRGRRRERTGHGA